MESRGQDLKEADKQQQQQQQQQAADADHADDDIVNWDGPDDPENPMNWPQRKRMGHVVMVSFITLVV
jgi:hypothetical protein